MDVMDLVDEVDENDDFTRRHVLKQFLILPVLLRA